MLKKLANGVVVLAAVVYLDRNLLSWIGCYINLAMEIPVLWDWAGRDPDSFNEWYKSRIREIMGLKEDEA